MLHLKSIDDKISLLTKGLAATKSIQRMDGTQDSLYEEPSRLLPDPDGGDASAILSDPDLLDDLHEGLEQKKIPKYSDG